MAGRIPQHFIDELTARADIVEIIGSRVPLKKAGREFRACCPFHDEKTPSFWVSPEKQFFHCFGCGAHGTALGFLMQYDQLAFPDAVEELAARLGLVVPREGGDAAPTRGHDALHELLDRVATHFQTQLAGNARAQQYLRGRGLDADIAARFRIGYAADAWNDVLRSFGTSQLQRQQLQECGLIIEREAGDARNDGHYDRFRDRIMFPIRDTRGRILGFGGRVLDKGEPKYLNSPETELFHKGRELYGLFETRLPRAPLRQLLVVEGYMDVVRLHQAGLHFAVATLGTATTPEHLRRAFRLVNTVSFAFDGDRAGRAAAWRALQNVLPEVRAGREIRFLFLPDGEDPDSLVGRIGASGFEQLLAGAQPLSEYLIAHLAAQVDLGHADGKAHFVSLVRPLWARLPPGVYRELLADRVAQEIGFSPERLRVLLAEDATATPGGAREAPEPATAAPPTRRSARPVIGRGGLITQAIQLLLHFPGAARQLAPAVHASVAALPQPGASVLAELLAQLGVEPVPTLAQLLERWRDRSEFSRLSALAAQELLVADDSAAARELTDAIARLGAEAPRRRLEALSEKPLEALSAEERLELQELTRSLRNA
ncbi:MAG TPA: DNA primase [Steroidobacteraceae bacterium]|nr:DNA primase [Steroidobacteraceae bacterium]